MPAPRHARPSRRRPFAALGVTALGASAIAIPLTSQGGTPTVKTIIEPAHDTTHVQAASPVTVARVAEAARYLVRPGDTLWKIAGRVCGDPYDYLALAYNNRVRNPDAIFAGQVLKVACQAAAAAVAAAYPPPATASQPVSPPASPPASSPPQQPVQAVQAPVLTAASGTFGCAALEALWEGAGGSPGEASTAAAIAMAESGGNPNAVSLTDDYGLWQINASNGALATLSPSGSARSAVVLSHDGTDWSPWTTYTSGAYEGRC
jgi:LysM repeat protein